MYRIVVVLLTVFVAVSVLLAQDDDERVKLDESTSVSGEMGRLIFSYPTGWEIDVNVDVVTFAGEEMIGAVTALNDLDPEDLTIDEALNTTMESLLVVPAGEVTYDSTDAITLRGREVAIRRGAVEDGELLLALENVEGTFVFWNFFTEVGTLDTQRATIEAMIASADFVASGLIPLTQSIDSEDGALSLNYPSDWVVETFNGTILLANSEAALFSDPFALDADQLQGAINVFDPQLLIAHGIEVGASPEAVLDGMLTLSAMSGETTDNLGDTRTFEIDGKRGAYAAGTVSDEQNEAGIIYVVIELNDSHGFMVFNTAPGATAQYIDLLQRIAAGLTFFGAADL